MKKIFLFFSLTILLIFTSAFSVKEWKDSLYQTIRDETIKGVKANLKQDILVGTVEGVVVGQVVFHDVVIPDFGQAKKVYVNFNPVTFAYEKDIVPAISKITIVDAEFDVERNHADQWNVFSILPPEEPGAPPPPPFRAKLVFKNCIVHYKDSLGFRTRKQTFREEISALNGEISFREKDKINFDLAGKVYAEPLPTQARVSGYFRFDNGKYQINLLAKSADLKKWGNYAVPLEPLTFEQGKVDLDLIVAPPKIKGWAASLSGRFSFYKAHGQFGNYSIKETYGHLFMEDDQLSFTNVKAHINDLPLEISGQFSDFKQHNLDLSLALKNMDIYKAASFIPQTENLALSGMGDALMNIRGTIASPAITGRINIKQANFYNQVLAGYADLYYKKSVLKIDIPEISVHKGKIRGSCQIDFSKNLPLLSLSTNLVRLDLASLSQNSPGIVGQASGKLNLAGPINDLEGTLSSNLSQALFLGQPITQLSSSFKIKEGDILLDNFAAKSDTALISATGKIGRDATFSFQTNAQGIKLAGKGILGKMKATVDLFQGDVSWKLDDNFLSSPLKNMTASGEALLSKGKIGDQLFDQADGKLSMEKGLIRIESVTFKKEQSTLTASGQTGIGYPTSLKIVGENVNLLDLKILNHLLIKEAKDPIGFADINCIITGSLSKETALTSLDSLLNLNGQGYLTLANTNLADIPILAGNLEFKWQDRVLSFSNCTLELPESEYLSFDLNLDKENQLAGKILGVINLSRIKTFTGKYGKLEGKLGFNLSLAGSREAPNLSTSFWLRNAGFNNINFSEIQGNANYANDQLILNLPIIVSSSFDEYEIYGTANLAPIKSKQPEKSSLNLDLKIIDADIASAIELFDRVQREVSRKIHAGTAGEKSKINLSSLALPTIQQFISNGKINLYGMNGKEKYFLKTWAESTDIFKNEQTIATEQIFGGELSGNVWIKGQLDKLQGGFAGKVKEGFFRDYVFENITTKASLKNRKIEVEKLVLSKNDGRLSAQGQIGLDGNISLRLSAKNLPMDILKVAFDNEFKGSLTMQASLEGPYQNPRFTATASARKVSLAGVSFDNLALSAAKDKDSIVIHNLSLKEGRNHSKISGSLILTPPGKLNLEAKLSDNAVGLLNLFNKEVKWINGKASVNAQIDGTLEEANINGEIRLGDSTIYVKAINAEIKQLKGRAKITNSLLDISGLTGTWQGKSSKDYPNPLGLAGSIDLTHLLATNRMVDLNLSLTPTHLYIDLPNLYSGEIKINSAWLYGPYYFDLSRGPTLSGEAEVNNAVITLAQKKREQKRVLPLNFDLRTKLDKNVYAVMGDVATFDLSNIFMNVEMNCDELKIAGSLAAPSLLGKIRLKRGTVTIFNREFSLLSADKQKSYYTYDPDKVKENVAVFSGEQGSEGALPDVTITAQVEVENSETDASGEIVNSNVIILSRLKGKIGTADKDQELSISFDSYTEDTTKTPTEYVAGNYSQQTIKVMLLPDFIKSLTGVSENDTSQVDTNVVIADYLSSRLQTWAFRGIGREIEQRLGLESLTLEYNFGKNVRQTLGVEAERTIEGEKPDWRVGFAKGFFDKFYIDVKYSQYSENLTDTDQSELLNYQLTYKLTPFWSIIYYREPVSLQELSTGYQKYTLKAGFSFW